MKKFRIAIIFVIGAIVFQGCVKNDGLDVCPQDAAVTTIALSIGDMPEVEVRSVATTKERTISDAYLLVFNSDSTYKDGEKVIVATAITNNGTQKPTLTTSLAISNSDIVALVVNTGVKTIPGSLVKGISTTAAIDAAFPLNKWAQSTWRDGSQTPMCGQMKWGVDAELKIYRSVAKISVAYSKELDDKTGNFANANVAYSLYNKPTDVLVYSPDGSLHLPTSQSYEDMSSTFIEVKQYITPAPIMNIYSPECRNSTQAKDTKVAANTWNKNRLCVILQLQIDKKVNNCVYYRLDLAENTEDGKLTWFDIQRNYHYYIIINKVLSNGYASANEALQNPGSNLEYEVVITGSEDNSITSNGQYAVTTDKSRIIVTDGISTAENLVKFRCEANGVADVTTRKVRLVGVDKSTVIPTTRLQMCKSDGTAIADNVFLYTSAAEAGYQLKFTSPDAASLLSDSCYVEICYGNIRHYVPVDAYVFKVTPPAAFTSDGAETKSYTVRSYKTTDNTAVAWTATEYSVDGGTTWTTTKPAWLTVFTDGDAGGTTAQSYNAKLAAQTGTNRQTELLRASTSVSNYDLSQGGETANCYIVNAPGTYSLPLIYGNARNANGTVNAGAFTASAGRRVLEHFLSATGTIPADGKITGATSATLVWQDAKNLVTNVALSGGNLTFSVNRSTIREGNAVVAVRNASNQILWSWHIWVTTFKLTEAPKSFVNYQNVTYKFMPYNIGWCFPLTFSSRSVKVRLTQNESGVQKELDINQSESLQRGNNVYFQWGRKDPFVGLNEFMHNKTWYDGSGVEKVDTPPIIASPAWTAASDATTAQDVIRNCILNPDTYCANTNMDYYYLNLWSAQNTVMTANDNIVVKTVYDPSPVGYHLPASNAFTGFTSDGKLQNATGVNGTLDETSKSWNYAKDGNTVNFPITGSRKSSNSSGLVVNTGYYWLAVPINYSDAWGMYTHSTNGGVVHPTSSSSRANGYSVRPVCD